MATNRRRTGTEKASLTGKSDLRFFFFALLFFVLLCVCARCKMDKVWKFGVLMVLRIVFFFFFWLQGIDATVDGVLGGYGHVNEVDIKGSEGFLKLLFSERLGGQSPNLVALGKLIFSSFFFWRGEVITSFFESEICDDCCCFQFKCKWHLFYYRLRHG